MDSLLDDTTDDTIDQPPSGRPVGAPTDLTDGASDDDGDSESRRADVANGVPEVYDPEYRLELGRTICEDRSTGRTVPMWVAHATVPASGQSSDGDTATDGNGPDETTPVTGYGNDEIEAIVALIEQARSVRGDRS